MPRFQTFPCRYVQVRHDGWAGVLCAIGRCGRTARRATNTRVFRDGTGSPWGGRRTRMVADGRNDAARLPARLSTGIPGLDDVLGGGLPQGHMYLIEGESGAGKTTLGLHFLLAGQRRGERTLWITLSETERQLRQS